MRTVLYRCRAEVSQKDDFNTMGCMMESQLYPRVMPRKNLALSGKINAGASPKADLFSAKQLTVALPACMRLWLVGGHFELDLAKGAVITLEMSV